jgi:hypothetical protein
MSGGETHRRYSVPTGNANAYVNHGELFRKKCRLHPLGPERKSKLIIGIHRSDVLCEPMNMSPQPFVWPVKKVLAQREPSPAVIRSAGRVFPSHINMEPQADGRCD